MALHRTNGLTVVELVVAMAVTSMVALTVTGAFMALNTAVEHSDEHYLHVQTARCVSRLVQAALRKSKLVTAAEQGGLVLWAGDTNEDGKINISEVLVFRYLDVESKLEQAKVVFPDSMDPDTRAALDVHKALADLDDVAAVREMMATDFPDYYCNEELATHVLSHSVYPDEAAPLTRMLKLRVTIGTARRSITVYPSGALRDDETDRVGLSEGEYVLIDPS